MGRMASSRFADFVFWVPLSNDRLEDASPFQGFTPSILELPEIIAHLVCLPQNLYEVCSTRNSALSVRMSGYAGHRIIPIQQELLPSVILDSPFLFICVITSPSTVSFAQSCLKSTKRPVLHATTAPDAGSLNLMDLDHRELYRFVDQVLFDTLFNFPADQQDARHVFRQTIKKMTIWPEEEIPMPRRRHGVTAPNEAVLESMRYVFAGEETISPGSETAYVAAIEESAWQINKALAELNQQSRIALSPPALEAILALPSMFGHIYHSKPKRATAGPYVQDQKTARRALAMFVQQKSYHFQTKLGCFEEMLASDSSKHVFVIRQREMAAFTAGLTVRAVATCCPVLRLPPRFNSFRSQLKQLAHCARSRGEHKRHKLARLFAELCRGFGESLPHEFADYVDRPFAEIKIVSDLPLEWMLVKGIPLLLHANISRIPVTPGNLFMQLACDTMQITIPPSIFSSVLILHSFDPSDPVGHIVNDAVSSFCSQISKDDTCQELKAVRRTVRSKEEFIEALNTFEGALLVFDGHGVHADTGEIGYLVVGEDRVSPWELREKCRFPPIVVLSACDTHAIDASHVSVGNGCLVAGAQTVLATVLPIDGIHAGIFVGRLLLRLAEFLPIAAKNGGIRWSEVVAGLLRMQYTTEIIHQLQEEQWINEHQAVAVSFQCNQWINARVPGWQSYFIDSLVYNSGKTPAVVNEKIASFGVLEAFRYVQMGNPENILILAQ